ncbi:MAG: TIGR04282 family arsenosugar biosynthesis glycosyltransferase [Deltaproteobacteria bacterium]|nr:MAG: TIGR04282 family arsenosugar biosynthesis glycosyltransferase [Deltaproteobacteria bacterium]
MKKDALILFFVKYPEAGKVKTRLAEYIGSKEAAELYRNFVLDLLAKLGSTRLPFRICFYPEQKRELLMGWLGNEYEYIPQRGADIGERMAGAFEEAFGGGYRRVILIGSDFPDLPQSFLEESLSALNTHDAVIGPSMDGGYYLIGYGNNTSFHQSFEGVDWGTEGVFRQTLSILKDHKKRVYVLPVWNDIDTIEDLRQIVERSESACFSSSKTMSFLSTIKLP